MAQCFTEAKPFGPNPSHIYGNACSGNIISSEHGSGNLDSFQGYKSGESSIRGYGSFGMPGGSKRNSFKGDKMKSSLKEEHPKEHLNGECVMSMASSVASNGLPADPKTEDDPKLNQSSRGGIVRDKSMLESHDSGRKSSTDIVGGDVLQSTGRTADETRGSKIAPSDNRTPAGVVISTGEASNLTFHKHDHLSKRTPVQSWPNSPANLRGVPRTRNLSEGNFNRIFPVGDIESMSGTRSSAGSPSRSWSSTEAGESNISSSASGSSSDGCLIGTMHSPVSTLQPVTPTKSCPADSSELRSTGFGSPTKDLQLAAHTKASTRFSRDSGHNSSRINTKLSDNLGSGSPTYADAKNAASATKKLSNSEIPNRCSSDACLSQKAGPLHGVPASSAFYDKSFNHGIITGGSFDRTLLIHPSVTTPKGRNPESMVAPTFGNITKGFQSGTKLNSARSSYGNIIKENMISNSKKPSTQNNFHLVDESCLLRSALSSMDPEEVKNIGNEHYKKGRFTGALQLYERAITLLPGQALFHSNRAAALVAVGRLGDAVHECQEAIKLDPLYNRPHQRLACLFLRLGRVEDAKKHFKAAGSLCDQRDIQQSDIILRHSAKCLEARMAKDWASVIRESDATVVAGADSASKVFAIKAEALLYLSKTDEAVRVISAAQKVEASLNMNTALTDSFVQIIQAEIDLASGKFQEAIVSAEKAVQMDASNVQTSAVLFKARIMGRSRTVGNELYKAGKFFEASAAYAEGLEHDPANSVLLCNRAACRSNLGLYESAIEDCDAALTAQPNYIKARLRRAHCFTKLEQWEEATRDYEKLRKELPGDIEVARALFELQAAWKKSREDESLTKDFNEIQKVSGTIQVREAVNFPGLVLLYFNSKGSDGCRQLSACIIRLCKIYPAVKFMKVEVEENRHLAKLENVTILPTFQLYKNGRKVKEIEGPSYETLEQAIQLSVS